MASRLEERLVRRSERAGLGLTAVQASEIAVYLGLLAKWNAKINLTSLPLEPATDAAIDRLVVEALAAERLVEPGARLAIDIGSGGGSPAVPIKVLRRDLGFVLVESKVRKCAFLREVVRELDLEHVEVANQRLEELLARPDLHESAEVVTLRAVRTDGRLWKSLQALVRAGGRVVHFGSASTLHGPVLPPFRVTATVPVASTGTVLTVATRLT